MSGKSNFWGKEVIFFEMQIVQQKNIEDAERGKCLNEHKDEKNKKLCF